MEKAKPILGAVLVAGVVLVPTLYGLYGNFKEVKRAEYLEAQDRAAIQSLKVSPTPSVTATPSASPTPTKTMLYTPTIFYKVSPVVK